MDLVELSCAKKLFHRQKKNPVEMQLGGHW